MKIENKLNNTLNSFYLPQYRSTTNTHVKLNKYLYKIGLHPNGLCDVCKAPESVEHFLMCCVKHKELSYLLSGSASALGHPPSLQVFLSSEPYISIIYNYVKANVIRI